MVSTRGHRDHEESKSNLPPRECRKPRTTLEEPEDDMFWESDEAENYGKRKTRSGVTFEPENSVGEPNTSHLSKDEDMIGIEADTDTDDDFFTNRRTSRSSNYQRNQQKGRHDARKCHSPITKEFVLNGDEMSDKSDHEIGLRRSSRHRKSLEFSQSWIFGDKKLRGYPNMIHSSEPENDECRPARKPSRYLHSGNDKNNPVTLPQRRSQRFCKNSSEQRSLTRNRDYLQRKHNSRQLLRRSRRPPLRYRDSPSEGEEEDEDKRRQGEEDEAKMTVRSQKREKASPLAKQCNIESLKNKLSVSVESSFRDDTGNSEDAEQFAHNDHPMTESEDKEDVERAMKERKEGAKEIVENSPQDDELEFVKPKRQRRPVTRLSYEPPQRQQAKLSSDTEIEEEQSDDDEQEEDNNDDEEDSNDDDDESKEQKGEVERERYSLRQNRKTLNKDPFSSSLDEPRSHRRRKLGDQTSNLKDFISSPARKQSVFNKRYRATHNSELSSTSSSSDEKEFEKRYSKSMAKARNRCLPLNFSPEEMLQSNIRERSKPGSSLADIDPMHVDKSVTFDSVGGLSQHIRSLKEMIIFPLLYQEVFQTFSVSPPRGVLFYGPPGTGKTLVARALASECSQKNRKVAFFMRKGADCLSKWVGESERQLRLLFDQAYQMRPSIIFFDEIDGLAPVRSTRQDQIHSSIVSTLLALMDGLDSRGEVVVIGATNRIDAIDSALRRPGRFDREFNFPLPSIKARRQIINIHTKDWSPKPSKRLVQYLSEQSVGYCGADLKALCAEAMLNALRFRYPQIYASKEKLLLDVSKIQIKLCHFRQALSKIVPAGQRVVSSPGRKLSKVMQPLLKPLLILAMRNLRRSFPQGFSKVLCDRIVHRPRLLLCGTAGQGQTSHLAPAILHMLENISMHKLDIPSLFSVSARAPEEACAQVFHEARRHLPSIIYIPLFDQWWSTASDTVQSTFLSLLNDFDPATPLFLLATSETPYDELHEQIQRLFNAYREEFLEMTNPKEDSRRCFFRPLFFTKMTQKPKVAQPRKRILETLPIAPPPQIRKLSPVELKKIEEIEESSLRELRIFLRQICAKLAKNRMFFIFTKPVDVDEVPDYLEVISTPMDLETMMTKIDHHHYQCAEDFLTDIDLICSNALEYNPDRNPEDKLIRHRACTLRDTAYAYIKAEMDTDFEMKCRDIRKARICRHQSGSELAPEFIKASPPANKIVANIAEKSSKSNSNSSTPLIPNTQQDLGGKSKVVPELNRKRKRKSILSRGSLSSGSSRKKKAICKEEGKKEDHKNGGPVKLQENNEAEAKTEDQSELDLEEDSSVLFESKAKMSHANNFSRNFDELPLCNGNMSTEDSRDSMRVTSAADLLHNQSFYGSLRSNRFADASEEKDCKVSNIEADESIVSSSEPGGSNEHRAEVLIDWSRLEAVYELCVSITEGCNIDELHHLYTLLGALIQKYLSSLDRGALLNEAEAELGKFNQFREKA